MAQYRLQVNGRTATVESWDPAQPLLYILRNALGLHGPKFGCGLGQCGACTVLIDGTPAQPDPVQAAFMAEQAAQCGYCTNGMIMAAKALLTQTPRPTPEQVKQGLDGYLCRCGTHTRILHAVLRAAKA